MHMRTSYIHRGPPWQLERNLPCGDFREDAFRMLLNEK